MLDFQRLEVYKVARELRCELVALMKALPRGHAETLDQLNRASLSLKLNLAEGSGEYAPKEKARFFRMARRSADECGALVDDLLDLGLITPAKAASPLHRLVRIVSMLIRLTQAYEHMPSATLRRPGHTARKRPPTPAPPAPQP
jgi:four helix bundle protein